MTVNIVQLKENQFVILPSKYNIITLVKVLSEY